MPHFQISGAFMTSHARSVYEEQGWDRGLAVLIDGLKGMTSDDATRVLRHRARLVGDVHGMDLEDDKPDADFARWEAERYTGLVRAGDQWWRPYAVITAWAPADMAPEVATLSSRYGSVLQGRELGWFLRNQPGAGRTREDWWRARSVFYMEDPRSDRAEFVRLADADSADLPGPFGRKSHSLVLFQTVTPPPFWVRQSFGWQDAVEQREKLFPLRRVGASPDDPVPEWVKDWEPPTPSVFPRLDDEDGPSPGELAHEKMLAGLNLEPVEPEDAPGGWITRTGQMYGCRYDQHRWMAQALLQKLCGDAPADPHEAQEDASREKGWILCGNYADGASGTTEKRPTRAQRDTWMVWAAANGANPVDDLVILEGA